MTNQVQVQSVNYRHEAIIDWMLLNYDKTLGQCANDLGYTQGWLSVVTNSDAFRAEYNRRRSVHNEELGEKARSKLLNIANKALDQLEDYIDGEEEKDPRFILDTADKTLNRYGFSPSKGDGMTINGKNVNVNVVDGGLLSEARERIRLVNSGERPRLVDATVVEKERPDGGS